MEWIKKKLSEHDDWLNWEILSHIENEFGVTYHPSYIINALKKNFGGYYSKPHRVDYRRSPYYKSTFYLMLYNKFRKYHNQIWWKNWKFDRFKFK